MIWNIVAATLAGALLRWFQLGHQSLWIDEVNTWGVADVGHRLSLATLLENAHGPLYGLIVHLWCGVAGDSEWAIRAPSALFGVLTIPIFAAFAARWLGSRTAGPAAWLTAGSPFLVWYSQEARGYALLLPMAALSWMALMSLRERVTGRALAGYFAASSTAMLLNPSFLLMGPLHLAAWLGPGRGRRRRVIALAIVVVAVLAVTAPWLPRLAGVWDWKRLHPGSPVSTEALRGGPAISLGSYPFLAHAFAVGYTLGPGIREIRTRGVGPATRAHLPELVAIGLLVAALAVLAARAARRRRVIGVTLLAVLVPVLLISYGAMRDFKTFHPRYVAVAYPFVIALLAAGLADARPRLRATLSGLLAVAWIVSLQHLYFRPEYGKEDMRSAARFVASRSGPGDRILAAGADDALIYYYRGPLPVERYWLGWSAQPGRMESKLEEARAGARNVWMVVSRGEDLDPEGRLPRLIQSRYPEAETYRSEGVRVWRIPGTAAPDSTH